MVIRQKIAGQEYWNLLFNFMETFRGPKFFETKYEANSQLVLCMIEITKNIQYTTASEEKSAVALFRSVPEQLKGGHNCK